MILYHLFKYELSDHRYVNTVNRRTYRYELRQRRPSDPKFIDFLKPTKFTINGKPLLWYSLHPNITHPYTSSQPNSCIWLIITSPLRLLIQDSSETNNSLSTWFSYLKQSLHYRSSSSQCTCHLINIDISVIPWWICSINKLLSFKHLSRNSIKLGGDICIIYKSSLTSWSQIHPFVLGCTLI